MRISQKAIDDLNHALSDFADAIGRSAAAMAVCISDIFADLDFSVLADGVSVIKPYQKAMAEHPEWVHRANYSKKKRIRKKYHDRIMRKYGERRCE